MRNAAYVNFDDDVVFADLPVSPTVQVARDRPDGLDELTEAERLGRQRLWEPIWDLRAEGPDDFYPPATSERLDAFCGRFREDDEGPEPSLHWPGSGRHKPTISRQRRAPTPKATGSIGPLSG